MTADEIEISRSTPNYTFDAPPPDPDAEAPEPADPGQRWSSTPWRSPTWISSSPNTTVVLFALEWCEFCWSVRKLFAAMQIPYHSVDLDSVAYQEGDLGGKIRAVLLARTGQADHPADLHRRRAHRRRHRSVRRVPRRHHGRTAGRAWGGLRQKRQRRPIRTAAEVVAPEAIGRLSEPYGLGVIQ